MLTHKSKKILIISSTAPRGVQNHCWKWNWRCRSENPLLSNLFNILFLFRSEEVLSLKIVINLLWTNENLYCKRELYQFIGYRDLKLHTDKHSDNPIIDKLHIGHGMFLGYILFRFKSLDVFKLAPLCPFEYRVLRSEGSSC